MVRVALDALLLRREQAATAIPTVVAMCEPAQVIGTDTGAVVTFMIGLVAGWLRLCILKDKTVRPH